MHACTTTNNNLTSAGGLFGVVIIACGGCSCFHRRSGSWFGSVRRLLYFVSSVSVCGSVSVIIMGM